MEWFDHYQLFLFDCDGLLVNTEELHYKAYCQMCAARGFHLDVTFDVYFQQATADSSGPEKLVYGALPELKQQEPHWDVLYKEKTAAYLDILTREGAPLLPGVAALLELLARMKKKRAVVTHSKKAFTSLISTQNPILNSIEHWITREDYEHPKPAPDGYLHAIKMLAEPGDRVIGFEDSLRGLQALIAADVTPVFISPFAATRAAAHAQGVSVFSSMNDLHKEAM